MVRARERAQRLAKAPMAPHGRPLGKGVTVADPHRSPLIARERQTQVGTPLAAEQRTRSHEVRARKRRARGLGKAPMAPLGRPLGQWGNRCRSPQ